MKALVQRVLEAKVVVEERVAGEIRRGILLFLGVEKGDEEKDLDYIVRKISSLRIFEDREGKMNLSVKDVEGEILVVSQFTLAGYCKKGNRPSFDRAEEPAQAEKMYLNAVDRFIREGIRTSKGEFGAYMQVHLVNDGPVTFFLDSRN